MHPGSIDNPLTGAGRVYAVLRARKGVLIGGWQLTLQAQVSAVSTRVSEVRAQLAADPARGECVPDAEQRGAKFFYRLVTAPGQMDLAI